MNYAIQQQYAYYRAAKDHGFPVKYMMETTGGCGVSAQNHTNNTLGDIESKVCWRVYKLKLPNDIIEVFSGHKTESSCHSLMSKEMPDSRQHTID